MKIILLALLLVVTTGLYKGALHAQQRLQSQLTTYMQQMKSRAAQILANPKNITPTPLEKPDLNKITCIPYCEIRGIQNFTSANVLDAINIRTDTTHFSYRVDLQDDSILVTPQSTPLRRLYSTTATYNNNDFSNTPLFLMMQYAMQRSPYCFALKIRDDNSDAAGHDIICYLNQNQLWVLQYKGSNSDGGIRLTRHASLQAYITTMYGSMQNFLTLAAADTAQPKTSNTAMLDAPKQTLGSSYFYYQKMYPADTATIASMLATEITTALALTNAQKDTLTTLITTQLPHCQPAAGVKVLNCMGFDVEPLLAGYLPPKQRLAYKRYYFTTRQNEQELFNTILAARQYWDAAPNADATTPPADDAALQARAMEFIFGAP